MHTLTSVVDGLVPAATLATDTLSPAGETVSGGIFSVRAS